MEREQRDRVWAALVATFLLLCTAVPGPAEAGSLRGGEPALDSGRGKAVLLSMKISRAAGRNHRVTLYKSVARQAKSRPTVGRSPSSGR
jgi:hypothetical protein